MPFGGIKVAEVPVHYVWHDDQGPHHWQHTYGLAYAGDVLSAFLLKELVSDALRHLEGLRRPGDFGFDDLKAIVASAQRHFAGDMLRHLGENENLDFFFAGFCPKTQRVRVAKFYVDLGTERTESKEIFIHDGVDCETVGIESAAARFRQLFQLNLSAPPCRVHFAAMRRLRDVITEAISPHVAGAIQYGEFDPAGNFTTSATAMLRMGEYGLEMDT